MRFSRIFGSLLAGSLAAASLIQPRDTCAIVDLDLNVLGIVLGKVDVCLWYVFCHHRYPRTRSLIVPTCLNT